MTLGLSRGMNGVTHPIVTLETIRPEDSGAAQSFSIKLHSETQVSSHLGMSGGRSPDMPRTPYRASEGKSSQ